MPQSGRQATEVCDLLDTTKITMACASVKCCFAVDRHQTNWFTCFVTVLCSLETSLHASSPVRESHVFSLEVEGSRMLIAAASLQ